MQETRVVAWSEIPHAEGQVSLWARAIEPRRWNYWSRHALEPGLQDKRSQRNKKQARRN